MQLSEDGTYNCLANYFVKPSELSNDTFSQFGFLADENFFDQQVSLSNLNGVFASFFSKINDGIFILDEQLRFVCVNEQLLKMTGLPANAVLGKPFYFYDIDTYPAHLQEAINAIIAKLQNKECVGTNLILSYRNSPEIAVWLDISAHQFDTDHYVYAGLMTNLTEKKSQQQNTLAESNYDKLTGLPSYDMFYEKLRTCIKHFDLSVDKRDCIGIVLRINIDKLQSFNLSIGIENTNQLIKSFVTRVASLKVTGTHLGNFSRFGGDSFAALVSVDDISRAEAYLQKLKQLFELPFTIDNQSIYLRLSVGVSIFPSDSNNAETLLLQADTALKHARLISDEDFVWYHNNQQENLFKNIHLLSAFRNALAKQQIVSYFQPKFCFNKPDLPMFEALVRWEHPTLGLLYPKDFLSEVLDKSSQPLFEKIITACVEQILQWQKIGYNCQICVNIDSRQLISEKFIHFIEATLGQYNWLPQLINFEITEVSKIHDELKAQVMLSKLHQLGFSISIDDFGTGFAAMQYLVKYLIDILKIDRLFITDILIDTKKQIIVKSVIDMAHHLSMLALAEGVSSEEEIAYLRDIGCDYIQGFGYCKPMSSEASTEWLLANFKPNYFG